MFVAGAFVLCVVVPVLSVVSWVLCYLAARLVTELLDL